jgi:acetyltransferase-like isoleucine patch superfamily enzyme
MGLRVSTWISDTVRRNDRLLAFAKISRNPLVFLFGYFYGVYLTLRYVDAYNRFPAIVFRRALIKLEITKGHGSHLEIRGQLLVEPLSQRRTPSAIKLGQTSKISILNDFSIGDDVQIVAHENAELVILGKLTNGSGISAKSLVHARSKISLGGDMIIAQDTYITDADWHAIDGSDPQRDVIIGDHVWIGLGSRVLKGSRIGRDSIVACGAVVVGGEFPERTLIGGVPARAIKSDIGSWHR